MSFVQQKKGLKLKSMLKNPIILNYLLNYYLGEIVVGGSTVLHVEKYRKANT